MNLSSVIKKLADLIDQTNDSELIEITNVATLNDGDEFLQSKFPIILSIVNIEEDKTLKNQSVYIENSNDKNTIDRFTQPTKHLIISLLFSSYNKDFSKYLDGIEKLEPIINFFQQNTSLFYKNDDSELIHYITYSGKNDIEKGKYSKITLDFVSLSMEQLNQMWSYLGSKYMPSVLFKMRLVNVQASVVEKDTVIKKVNVDLWENNKDDITGLLETIKHPIE